MMSSTARSQGKQKLCAYCDRTFTKVEHLKRHQRSRELHSPHHDVIEKLKYLED